MKKQLKLGIILFACILSAVGAEPVAGRDFPYDPAIEPDFSLHGTIQGGFWIFLLPDYPLLQFRRAEDGATIVATYHWKHQYWGMQAPGFDPGTVDLAPFFRKVDLSRTILNRDIAGLSPLRAGAATPPAAAAEGERAPAPGAPRSPEDTLAFLGLRRPTWKTVGFRGFSYDLDAVPDLSWSGKVMGKYLVLMLPGSADIIFRDAADPAGNLGQYNILCQYWSWRAPGFDSASLDLGSLYLRLDREKVPVLDRPMPMDDEVISALPSESEPYDYSADQDFGAFMKWMEGAKVKESLRKFFLMAGSNPSKRGRVLPFFYGSLLSHRDAGMEPDAFKPASQKGILDGSLFDAERMSWAGGMQYYFELRSGVRARAYDAAFNIFVDNATVPIVLVEADNSEYRGKAQPMLRAAALRKQAEKDLEAFFRKDVLLSYQKISFPYSELGAGSQGDFDRVVERYARAAAGEGKLFILYLTDAAALKKIDPDRSHPLAFGAYGTDWARLAPTIIHEFGHSLGLRHHFGARVNSSSLEAHISHACVMNYRYTSREFCPLCRYGLRLDR